ncbi:MAG: hypothetical protein IPP71_07365 [Bacteroidetes bacterium]|nr:hypothetical protein [Bacteroidota bacterium]
MTPFINRLVAAEKYLSKRVVNFNLFAAFQKDDLFKKWDIYVSFQVNEIDRNEIMEKISKHFQSNLLVNDLISISRIMYLPPNDKFVKSFTNNLSLEHSCKEVDNPASNQLHYLQAYIITSSKKIKTSV